MLELYKQENIYASKYFKYVINLMLDYVVIVKEKSNSSVKVSSKNTRSCYKLPDMLSFEGGDDHDVSNIETLKTRANCELEVYRQLV